MGVLDDLEPKNVFHYFEEICRIPHRSGNVRQISDYLKQFARERGLVCIQDHALNIIIVKEAAQGYEHAEPLILQGHMDMVAVSRPGNDIDMSKEPLRLRIEDGKIRAEGTSLGGDDGIAIAYALALLDADNIGHPRLEIVLTVDEEVGLIGAHEIDLSMLQGKRMINLDQEEEGVIITSCAGGARADVTIPMRSEKVCCGGVHSAKMRDEEACGASDNRNEKTQLVRIQVQGLLGGHSGIEIDKGRGNANCILGKILREVSEQFGLRLLMMKGGEADNAIPREAEALIAVDITQTEGVISAVRKAKDAVFDEIKNTDAGFTVVCGRDNWQEKGGDTAVCFDAESSDRALRCLCALPNGIIAMSEELEGLVQTSLNLGVVTTDNGGIHLSYAVRSSVDKEKERLCGKLSEIAAEYGAGVQIRNEYPGWAYRADSPLRDIAVKVYEDIYGRKPVPEAIHAGVECGLLAGKIEGLDCISIGPDMSDVHTAEESLDIASVQRTWEYLLGIVAYQ